MDWEVGTHGIEIDFTDNNGRRYGGTFLPEVAEEQEWNQVVTLRHLIKKAGYNGKLEDVIKDMKLKTYKSSKVSMSFQEYQEKMRQYQQNQN